MMSDKGPAVFSNLRNLYHTGTVAVTFCTKKSHMMFSCEQVVFCDMY